MRRRAVIASLAPLALAARRVRRRRRQRRGAAPTSTPVVAGEPFPTDRCEANKAAGTITYLSGFDFAAAASIMEVVVADDRGYYDDLCLDVELTPSFSTTNYPLVASNEAQFSSAGSFTELASFSAANDADLVALSIDGHTPIDVLMVHPEQAESLAELNGATIGIKGALPAGGGGDARSRRPTSPRASSTRRCSSTASIRSPTGSCRGSPAIPGWRSNEPGALERAGLAFDLYDPADYDIPGSFGVIYTSRDVPRASTRRQSRTSCGRRCAASPTRSPIRPARRRSRSSGSTGTAIRTSCRRRARRSAGRPTPRRSSPRHREGSHIGVPIGDGARAADQRVRRGRLLGRRASPRRSKAATTPTW